MPWGPTPPSSSGGSDASIVTPRVLHVTTAGDDSTGTGALTAPFATLTKALEAAWLTGSHRLIDLGANASPWETTLPMTNPWPDVTFRGCGPSLTTINIATNRDISVKVVGHSARVNVNGQGPAQVDGAGAIGNTGPSIYVTGAFGGSILSVGGTGGTGVSFIGGEGGGGSGGNGGTGGTIKLVNCVGMLEARSGGGLGGAGGTGDGDGPPGSNGSKGNLYLLQTSLASAECEELYFGCSNVEDTTSVYSIVGDYGGNANMSIPTP